MMLIDGGSDEELCEGRSRLARRNQSAHRRRLSRRTAGEPHLVPDDRTDVEDAEPEASRHRSGNDRPGRPLDPRNRPRVGRDVKAVHGDVTALIEVGVIDRQDRGVVFPYDAVHVDFVFGKAA